MHKKGFQHLGDEKNSQLLLYCENKLHSGQIQKSSGKFKENFLVVNLLYCALIQITRLQI